MPRYSKTMNASMAKSGHVYRKATLDERAEKLVFFSKVMLRRTLNINDAKCLLQNWEPYGPNEKWWFPKSTGGKTMAAKKKTVRKIAKKAKVAKAQSPKKGR